MPAEYTLKQNLIIPEVLASMVEAKLTDNMVLYPLATIDNTLVGNPGDTIKYPVYAYIGDATDIDENGLIEPVALNQTFVSATVKKVAKAVTVTDEAQGAAYGDPLGEAARQIALAIDSKGDNDLLEALEGVSATRQFGTQADFSPDVVADALTIFGEDEEGVKALLISAEEKAILRKSDDFIKACDIGQNMVLKGAVGEIWGCQIIVSNKIKENSTTGEKHLFIVKPGALRLVNKRGVMIEPKREAEYQRTSIFGSKHYTAYLYDESKVVMIRKFTDLKELGATDVVSTAGESQNGTFLNIKVPAPVGFRWVYKLGTTDGSATFGTALSGYTDWAGATTEIAASTSTKAHIALVDAENKPVKHKNVTLVKKG